MKGPRFAGVEIVADRTAESRSDEGFLKVRRWVLRNAYDDGNRGAEYSYDVVEREALDAVAIAAFDRERHVWMRRCLRPPLLSRARSHVPIPWAGGVTLLEVPAGLIDPDERGWEGVAQAAARELAEETGIVVEPASVRQLGEPYLLSPGVLGEMIFSVAVEVPVEVAAGAVTGDEEVERGAELVRLPLDEAIAGATDAKSEITLRRLREIV